MAISQINFDVVESLQNQLAKVPPGSQREQVLEKALDYALSVERKSASTAFLLHDVIRDARKAVYRTGVLAQRFQNQLDHVVSRGGRFAGFGLVDHHSPESSFIAGELEADIRNHLTQTVGEVGIRCLEGLLDGHSVPESSRAIGVSASTVDRTRRKIRLVTTALIGAAA